MKKLLNQISLQSKQNFLLVITLLALFFFLGHHNYFFSSPMGIHFVRQADSLAFVYGYFNNGFHFYEPSGYFLESIDGKAACDFPIIYYITALSFKIFGEHMFILKVLHLLITYIGVFYLFRLINVLLKNFIFSFLIILLLFTSTVFNYYSFSYLPDTAALGFIFIGLYFINKYRTEPLIKNARLAFLFFSLGGLVKVTYFIYPLAVLSVAIFILIFGKREGLDRLRILRVIRIGVISSAIVLLWNLYLLYYNAKYQVTFFNTKPLPIWELTQLQIKTTWEYITSYWYSKYFALSTFHLLWILLGLQIFRLKKLDTIFSLFIGFAFLGFLSYFALFYRQFQHHDYYFLVGMPLLLLFFTNGILAVKSISSNKYFTAILQITIAIIAISGINYSRMKLPERIEISFDNYNSASRYIEMNQAEIKKLNFPSDAKFIVGPDEGNNGSFLFLKRPGWTIPFTEHITESKIEQYKSYGAFYFVLIHNDPEKVSLLKSLGKTLYKNKNLSIYKLNR